MGRTPFGDIPPAECSPLHVGADSDRVSSPPVGAESNMHSVSSRDVPGCRLPSTVSVILDGVLPVTIHHETFNALMPSIRAL